MNFVFPLLPDLVWAIFTGIVASIFYYLLTKIIEDIKFEYKLKHIESKEPFDYECYSMRNDNGRLRESITNRSKINIKLHKDWTIKVTLLEDNGRQWHGDLIMEKNNANWGNLFFKYDFRQSEHSPLNEFEFAFRRIYIGQEIENGITYDILFLIDTSPIRQKASSVIHKMKDKQGKDIEYVELLLKDYGRELARRERKLKT